MRKGWFLVNREQHLNASQMDLAWALVRLCPTQLFEIDIVSSSADEQRVPSWSAFNALVHQAAPLETNVGYCPMINASPTQYNTVYTVMKTVQTMMAQLGQKDTVITFDLAIYVKVKEFSGDDRVSLAILWSKWVASTLY